ncbi:hypothetical protein NE590_17210, partial [Blautia obeum]|uniref:HD-GYP domain-containing protein n=1 Tax=Blautia obeum TaxID=40520 RepID=UPI0029F19396|nr:hypothetical protein [Blautia obeum]
LFYLGVFGCSVIQLPRGSPRIIAVADSLDAMSSDRCYRKALPWKTCISEIDRNNGIMYDPDVVNAFHLCQDEISQIISNL